ETPPAASNDEPETTGSPATVEEMQRPQRRYRFDRPSAAVVAATTPAPRVESLPVADVEVTPSPAAKVAAPPAWPARFGRHAEPAVASQPAGQQEAPLAPVPVEPENRRGRFIAPTLSLPAASEQPSAAEAALSAAEPTAPTAEINPEDLPPLEYAELQKANSRRRRRSKHNGTAPVAAVAVAPTPAVAPDSAPVSLLVSKTTTPPSAAAMPPVQPASAPPIAPTSPVAVPRPAAMPPVVAPSQYSIHSGYTMNQMNQGDGVGPFMPPEPSPARGSTLSSSSRLPRIDRSSPAGRSVEGSHITISNLTGAITQAFQTQTDRMIAELRRANQTPTNITVSMPTMPSTERVGVFVDVANLLYSARTLRITVDFGKLLDFLRGNRRLVRAQAYCPTSPQPGDEQMFLQAVKGLGYRITTKNYKTFASGAKKADLDLDLCMDVVRLVDGRAVDSIVLVSGDSDFMPMLDYCSDHGVRVEVAAFDEAMSATLRQSCDLFVNLAMLEEIRV
ncbi:MAG: NYN domain-containing protein, partial [Ktedonobacteraceae bacterium]